MGKAVITASATGVVGAGAAALTTAHYMGAFGLGDYYIGTTTAELTSYNSKCLDNTFGSEGKISENLSDITTFDISDYSDSQGCLAFNWDKWKVKNKWGGNFRFVWSFAGNTSGFVVYLSGNTDTSNSAGMKMKFDGIAYAFTKDSNGTWSAKNKLDLKQRELGNSQLEDTFPKLLDKVKNGSSLGEYGNFLDESKKQVKAPGNGEKTYKYAQWKWEKSNDSSSNQLWTKNLDIWGQHFFGDSSRKMSSDAIKNIKGEWR